MKRKMLPCLSLLALCVALLCVGVYAIAPKTHNIWGVITVQTKGIALQLRAYYESPSTPLTDYVTLGNGESLSIPQSDNLHFDVSNVFDLDNKPTITLIIGVNNISETALGAYFVKTPVESGKDTAIGNIETEKFFSATMDGETIPEVIKVTFPEYTQIDADAETYLYLTVSLEKLLDKQSSVDLNLVLNLDETYDPPEE